MSQTGSCVESMLTSDSDDGPRRDDRRDDRRDNYGGGGRDEYGGSGHGGGQGGYGGGAGNYGSGQGGYGRNDYDRPQGGSGYGGQQDRYDNQSGRRDDDYDRRFNQSGGGPPDRYGGQGKPYAGPQSGQQSTPYEAPTSGYDGPHRPGQGGGGYGGGGGYSGGGSDFDDNEIMNHSSKDDDKGFFSSALSLLKGRKDKDDDDDIDEGRMQKQHDKVYQSRPESNQDSNSLGAAAAMHAFQMFNGGDDKSSKSSSGGQSKLLGMAFKEASSLLDKQSSQGNVQSGVDKQSVINSAGKYALKMYLKNQGGGGGLLSMASKFM